MYLWDQFVILPSFTEFYPLREPQFCYWLLWCWYCGFTYCYRVFHVFIRVYWVLPSFYLFFLRPPPGWPPFYRVQPCFIDKSNLKPTLVCVGFYLSMKVFSYRSSPSFTGFLQNLVKTGFSFLCWVCLKYTSFYRMTLGFKQSLPLTGRKISSSSAPGLGSSADEAEGTASGASSSLEQVTFELPLMDLFVFSRQKKCGPWLAILVISFDDSCVDYPWS